MEKKVYELEVHETLENVMPPLRKDELERLTKALMEEGCRDALVVWNRVIVDGHNRYRICREKGIPFRYIEKEFEDEADAKKWIIDNQLGRRNVPDYVKCERVLPLEDELKELAKRRQVRKPSESVPPTLAGQKRSDVRDEMAQMAGVSHGTFDKAKKLFVGADEETKEKLRKGEISIHGAYTEMNGKKAPFNAGENDPEKLERANSSGITSAPGEHDNGLSRRTGPITPPRSDILPGYGLIKDLPPMEEGAYVRPPDSVYDIPPVEVYGNMPADDMKLRGNAELAHAKSEMTGLIDYCVRRTSEILRGMSAASISDENLDVLSEIAANGFGRITELINQNKNGGNNNE